MFHSRKRRGNHARTTGHGVVRSGYPNWLLKCFSLFFFPLVRIHQIVDWFCAGHPMVRHVCRPCRQRHLQLVPAIKRRLYAKHGLGTWLRTRTALWGAAEWGSGQLACATVPTQTRDYFMISTYYQKHRTSWPRFGGSLASQQRHRPLW